MTCSICRCCGDKIVRAGVSNPNICSDCEEASFDVAPRRSEQMPFITLSGNRQAREFSALSESRCAEVQDAAA